MNLSIKKFRSGRSDSALCKSDQDDDVTTDGDMPADQYYNIVTNIVDELAPVTEFTVENQALSV